MAQVKTVPFSPVGGVTANPSLGFAYDGGPFSTGAGASVASDYDGTIRARLTSAITGLAAGKKGVIAFWLRIDSTAAQQFIIASNGNRVLITVEAGGDFLIQLYNDAPALIGRLRTSTALSTDTWYHIAASWDLVRGVSGLHLYVDGEDDLEAGTRIATDDDIEYDRAAWGVGASAGGTPSGFLDGCMSQFYFNGDEYVDLSVAANLAKFYDGGAVYYGANGELPTGSQPTIFAADGDPNVNDGYGENFDDDDDIGLCITAPNPTWKRMIWIGDSISDDPYNYDDTTQISQTQQRGLTTWTLAKDESRLSYNLWAEGGDTTDDIIANLGDIEANKPDVVVIQIGQNDFGTNTAAEINANLDTIWNYFRGADIAIINSTLWCRNISYPGWPTDDSKRDDVLTVNAHIAAQPEVYADFYGSFNTDKNTLTDDDLLGDGLHPSSRGGELMSQLLLSLVQGRRSNDLPVPLTTTDTDKDSATNIWPNPLFTGSNAISSGVFSGTIADDMDMASSIAGGGDPTSVVCTAGVSNPNGTDFYQQFVATFSAANESFRMRPTSTKYYGTMLDNIEEGAEYWVEARMEITGPASTEMPGFYLRLRLDANTGSGNVQYSDAFAGIDNKAPLDSPGEIVLVSKARACPADMSGAGALVLAELVVISEAAGTWTFKIGQMSIRKGAGYVTNFNPDGP